MCTLTHWGPRFLIPSCEHPPLTSPSPIPPSPTGTLKPWEGFHKVSRDYLSTPEKAHGHQQCRSCLSILLGERGRNLPAFHLLAWKTLPPSPAPTPVNTSGDNMRATGELRSCLLHDSFCQIPGGWASPVLPAPWGWRMGNRTSLRGWDPNLTGTLFFACCAILEVQIALH